MDELDLFRDFRAGVAGPTRDAERRASARLREATDGRHGPATRVLQLMRKRRGGTTLVLASLAGAVAAALFVSGPWTDSPGFLEKAQAALAPPADSVLHMRWMTTRTSLDFGCTVAVGPNESWVDQTPPNRYRLIDRNLLPPRAVDRREIACAADTPIEFGGTLAPSHSVRFVPPNTLTSRAFPIAGTPDFVKTLREAIANGSAHDEGRTELDGRTVERIRMAPAPCPESMRVLQPTCPPPRPSYAYLDPDSFHPVQIDMPYGVAAVIGHHVWRFHIVERYLTYEYLPRKAANLALTDIRAQHPDARGP